MPFWSKHTTSNTTHTAPADKKWRPYRNRPSKCQAFLELLSFCLLLSCAASFLGGTIGIFVTILTFALAVMGLFAWTRRHAILFALLDFAIIVLCILNIVLRANRVGACMPYFRYSQNFDQNGLFNGGVSIDSDDDDVNYDESIWCGNKIVVFITHGIILLFAIPAFIVALFLLRQRRRVNPHATTGATAPVTHTTTTTSTVTH